MTLPPVGWLILTTDNGKTNYKSDVTSNDFMESVAPFGTPTFIESKPQSALTQMSTKKMKFYRIGKTLLEDYRFS